MNARNISTADLIEEWRDLVGGDENNPDPEVVAELDDIDRARIDAIRELSTEVDDWGYVELIHEDEFEDYARQLAEDIGAVDSDASWPAYCIDWERAARELAHDFTSVDFEGESYYVR